MTWLYLLGGLLIWAAHFFGSYALSSLAVVLNVEGEAPERWAVGALSAAAALASAVLLTAALVRAGRNHDDLRRFTDTVAAFGAFLALVAVLWQSLPLVALGG